jgi:hypothetical protein
LKIVKVKTKKQCEELRKIWALTFSGISCDADTLEGIAQWVEQYTSYTNKVAYLVSGEQINAWYKLTDKNAFPSAHNFICISQHDLKDYNKIALARFDVGGRWLKDIISDKIEQSAFKRKAS